MGCIMGQGTPPSAEGDREEAFLTRRAWCGALRGAFAARNGGAAGEEFCAAATHLSERIGSSSPLVAPFPGSGDLTSPQSAPGPPARWAAADSTRGCHAQGRKEPLKGRPRGVRPSALAGLVVIMI